MLLEGLYIGVMSGTSLDGVDCVLAKISKNSAEQIAANHYPYPLSLKQSVLAICHGQPTTLSAIGLIDHQLGELYSAAVNALVASSGYSPAAINAIGCHGQTVWHQPESTPAFTIQLGDNNVLAAKTGITVVGDFRRRDMAYGGQGAPLVPAFHAQILSDPKETRVVVNIGGMANISVLAPQKMTIGYDTGPGNVLMDNWTFLHQNSPYDKDAAWASAGKVNEPLLQAMLADPYFAQRPPKSTGREYFNLAWIEHYLAKVDSCSAQDVQRTLAELTALTISQEILQQGAVDRVLLCGGGAHNPLVFKRLSQLLPQSEVTTTDKFGIRGDDMEALAFAWLAAQTYSGLPGNLPAVTGASQLTLLGAIYPRNPLNE